MTISERTLIALGQLVGKPRPSYANDYPRARRNLKELTVALVRHDRLLDPSVTTDLWVMIQAGHNQHLTKGALDYIFPRPCRV